MTTTGRQNGPQVALWLELSNVCCPIRQLGLYQHQHSFLSNFKCTNEGKENKERNHCLLGYSELREKVVSCIFRPPELVGGRVKCWWEANIWSATAIASSPTDAKFDSKTTPLPLIGKTGATMLRTAMIRPSRSTLTKWWTYRHKPNYYKQVGDWNLIKKVQYLFTFSNSIVNEWREWCSSNKRSVTLNSLHLAFVNSHTTISNDVFRPTMACYSLIMLQHKWWLNFSLLNRNKTSKMLKSTAEWWVSTEMVCSNLGSQMTISASEPTAMHPFFGYMLNILAALVDVTATKRAGSILPETTPFSQMSAILSSTPLTPFGILVKSPLPISFWADEKVQWSVPVNCKSSLYKSDKSLKNMPTNCIHPFQRPICKPLPFDFHKFHLESKSINMWGVSGWERSGGLIKYAAPWFHEPLPHWAAVAKAAAVTSPYTIIPWLRLSASTRALPGPVIFTT